MSIRSRTIAIVTVRSTRLVSLLFRLHSRFFATVGQSVQYSSISPYFQPFKASSNRCNILPDPLSPDLILRRRLEAISPSSHQILAVSSTLTGDTPVYLITNAKPTSQHNQYPRLYTLVPPQVQVPPISRITPVVGSACQKEDTAMATLRRRASQARVLAR